MRGPRSTDTYLPRRVIKAWRVLKHAMDGENTTTATPTTPPRPVTPTTTLNLPPPSPSQDELAKFRPHPGLNPCLGLNVSSSSLFLPATVKTPVSTGCYAADRFCTLGYLPFNSQPSASFHRPQCYLQIVSKPPSPITNSETLTQAKTLSQPHLSHPPSPPSPTP